MPTTHLELTDDALRIVKQALVVYGGVCEAQSLYGRQDERDHWIKEECAVDDAAQSILEQTGEAA